jgi:hypothetical protein
MRISVTLIEKRKEREREIKTYTPRIYIHQRPKRIRKSRFGFDSIRLSLYSIRPSLKKSLFDSIRSGSKKSLFDSIRFDRISNRIELSNYSIRFRSLTYIEHVRVYKKYLTVIVLSNRAQLF